VIDIKFSFGTNWRQDLNLDQKFVDSNSMLKNKMYFEFPPPLDCSDKKFGDVNGTEFKQTPAEFESEPRDGQINPNRRRLCGDVGVELRRCLCATSGASEGSG
jgi:hypothetical protein